MVFGESCSTREPDDQRPLRKTSRLCLRGLDGSSPLSHTILDRAGSILEAMATDWRRQGKATEITPEKGAMLSWDLPEGGESLSLRLLAPWHAAALRLFQELVNKWLLQGGRLGKLMALSSCECTFEDLPERRFTLIEMHLVLVEGCQREEFEFALQQLEREVVLGFAYPRQLYRILSLRPMGQEEKILTVQERVLSFVARHPREAAAEMLSEMHYFLAAFRDEFTESREPRHLARIIASAYLFRRRSRQQSHEVRRRGIMSRVFAVNLSDEQGMRKSLAVMVGICPLRRQEIFDEGHLLVAIRAILPDAEGVVGSFLSRGGRPGGLKTLYLEVTPKEGVWTEEQIKRLRRELPAHCRQAIEMVMHSLFMPRNEEEVMRNMITLGRELRYVSDLPQVHITFDQQLGSQLVYTVVMARLVGSGGKDLGEILLRTAGTCAWSIERQRTIGTLRKRYLKEASVLRVAIGSETFLRPDHSLDLTKVRDAIVLDLEERIGPFRDYNGGLLQQQQIVLQELKRSMDGMSQHQEMILEAFFHGIYPGERRTMVDPAQLVQWFKSLLVLLETAGGIPEELHMRYSILEDGGWGLVVMPESMEEDPFHEVHRIMDAERECVSLSIQGAGWRARGFLCLASDPALRETLLSICERRLLSAQPN
ncbi:MAG: hypothetical protein ACOYKZ_07440 [Chlamydiia bacterium]